MSEIDRICAEAFARLDALDEKLYQRGFVTCKGSWYRPSVPIGADTSTKGKQPKGPSPLTVNKPEGAPILPPSPVYCR